MDHKLLFRKKTHGAKFKFSDPPPQWIVLFKFLKPSQSFHYSQGIKNTFGLRRNKSEIIP